MGAAEARKQSRPLPHDDIEDCDELYDTRMPSSTRRYTSTMPHQADTLDDLMTTSGKLVQRRSSLRAQRTTVITPKSSPPRTNGITSNALTLPRNELPRFSLPRIRSTWTTLLIGMVLMIMLIMLLGTAFSWWQTYQDDTHFGRPRTYQFDAIVGHNDNQANQTHFILINLKRRIQVIEFPGGDSSHARIFYGPTLLGEGQDLVPVTGEVRDINGRKDLVLHIQNQEIVFVNDGSTFHPQ